MKHSIAVSVIIPAHNEEKYIGRCIRSVKQSAKMLDKRVEIITVCNRCTDRTAEIAAACGSRVVFNEDRCIAKVRNTGISAARGRIIVTIDADNRMTRGTLSEIYRMMKCGRYIGGGAPMRFERYSFPLLLNDLMCRAAFGLTGLYCGIFWAEKASFDAIGGFADIKAMEDAVTASRLKKLGKERGLKYTCLRKNFLINSVRKFDAFGDWLYFRLIFENAGAFISAAFGNRQKLDSLLDRLFYDFNA
ncbi:MAG: glycosyltransferase [Oscillospiraceae bacterium]|nr:glycosyltransferase [Oscillospiraceae bacterium]